MPKIVSHSDPYRRSGFITRELSIHRSTLWRWVREGYFPAPVELGAGVKVWRQSALDKWRAAKEAASAK